MTSETKTVSDTKNMYKKSLESPEYTESTHIEIDYDVAKKNHCLISKESGIERDSIKILRTHLLNHTRANGWRTVMVTSVQPGEGKTVTAINLAFAMAQEHQQTVVLVDCDLRRPSIARYLGIKKSPGLAEYFLHDKPLNEIIRWPGVEKLTMIAGSRKIADPTEIIGSQKMGALVAELKNRYRDRYAFFDLPPLLSNADPIAFMPHVDCVILVVEAGRTTIREIRKAQSMIPPEKLLGFVLNKDNMPGSKYYY